MPEIYHFFQQLVNGLTIGSTYALIAIGYTMVYGIIGMINFAHGEVYMIGSYVAFIALAGLAMMGIDAQVSEREQNGRTVYRVRVGPFTQKPLAELTQEQLNVNGVESALVRVQR